MTVRNVFWPVFSRSCSLPLSAVTGGAVVQADDGAVGFAESELVEQRGDVATIQLELANTDGAELLIRSAQRDYAVDLAVHDGDGDGTVRVRFNTFYGLDGPDRPAFSAAGADDGVTVLEQSNDQSRPVLDAGRYNLIAATDTSRVASVLRVENGSIGESRSVAVPRTADSPSALEDGPTGDRETGSNTRVARGDVGRVEFEVSGLGGVVRGPNPSDNLVFANDSRAGAETTHRLRLSPDRDVETAWTLSVHYDGSGETTPDVSATSWENIHTIGIDGTGDDRIDRSLAHDVTNLRTTTDGELRVRFDDPISLSTSETLFVKYPVTNPDVSGTEDVRVGLGPDRYAETGAVGYGTAGLGTLGHGIDLRIRNADSRTEIASPAPATTYDSTTNTLTASVRTEHLEPGKYDVQLRVHDESPLEHDGTVLTERLTVVPRSVNLSSVELTEGSTLSVDATTNLAPGNRVSAEVSANPSTNEGEFLIQCVGVVERDGTVTFEFDLPDPLIESTAAVSIERNGTTLAGPAEYELPAAERERTP